MDEKLDQAAIRAYVAFCDAARPWMPPEVSPAFPDWTSLPETLKAAWRAAATAVRADK